MTGVPDGWYWTSGWAKTHYVYAGSRTMCGHVARNLVSAAALDVSRCRQCLRSRPDPDPKETSDG